MITEKKYHIPTAQNLKAIFELLADNWVIQLQKEHTEDMQLYDTFDWRLYNRNLALFSIKHDFHLRRLNSNLILLKTGESGHHEFANQFISNEFRKQLEAVIKDRALLKLSQLLSYKREYRVLNADDKTVVRIILKKYKIHGKNDEWFNRHVSIKPVTGYKNEFNQVVTAIEHGGFKEQGKEDIFFKVMNHVGKIPGDYSSKFKIQLHSTSTSANATKQILRVLIETIKTNEPYVKQDIDTEFLHDFRVAIRRARSALSQIKGVFSERTTEKFKNELAAIGRFTNELRDLDVYFQNENTYLSLLPDFLKGDFEPVSAFLKEKRKKVIAKVKKDLESETYTKAIADIESFISHQQRPSSTAVNAQLPVTQLAKKRIYKKYKTIVSKGEHILLNVQEELLHELRIDFKKLRYLLEFFNSLFPQKKMTKLIKHQKKIQDNLGCINDYFVQQEFMSELISHFNQTKNKKTLLAIGSLIGILEERKQIEIKRFASVFSQFTSAENKALFTELFKPEQYKEY